MTIFFILFLKPNANKTHIMLYVSLNRTFIKSECVGQYKLHKKCPLYPLSLCSFAKKADKANFQSLKHIPSNSSFLVSKTE